MSRKVWEVQSPLIFASDFKANVQGITPVKEIFENGMNNAMATSVIKTVNRALIDQDIQALQELEIELSPCQTPATRVQGVDWQVLRLDTLPLYMNGNKGFKLLPALQQAAAQGHAQVISFGGAHSNHLYALAHAAKRYGFTVIAVVRAYVAQPLTPTLKDCLSLGMQLHFADKAEYAKRHQEGYWQQLQAHYGASAIVSEGGAGKLGVAGAGWIAKKLRQHCAGVDAVSIAVGTGTCLQGLLADESSASTLLGFLSLKNKAEIEVKLEGINAKAMRRVKLLDQFDFGGFAKTSQALAVFMRNFEQRQGFHLDPIYNAKMFYGMNQLVNEGWFARGSRIVSIHTGGLQGRRVWVDKWRLESSADEKID